jgi:hypothetical protein
MFLFRVGHRPFLLPWASVTKTELKRGFLGTRYELAIDDPAGRIRLWLPPAAEAALVAARGAARKV